MRFSLFNPWPVYGVPVGGDWPLPPSLSLPAATTAGMRHGFEISVLADEVGFDHVTVAEHHYHPRQLSPNPILSAAALSQQLTRAGVAVLGATLPLVNPIRTAEEFAVLDAMTGGNLVVGLFRGSPNEYLTYGTNPAETREVFEEAVALITAAWTQPEPFAWVGRHFDYRVVSVWPRPVSRPHPPILVSGNSPTSISWAARHRYRIGIAFAPAPMVARSIDLFREEAARNGWSPAPEDMLHRSYILVGETDAEALRLAERYGFGDMRQVFQVGDPRIGALLRDLMNGSGGSSRGPDGPRMTGSPPRLPLFLGSPSTVTTALREFAEQTGVGHFDLLFNDMSLPFEHAVRGVRLFGEEVLPALRAAPVAAAAPSAG